MRRLLVGMALLGAFSFVTAQEVITSGAIPADCAGEFLHSTVLWMNGREAPDGGMDDNRWTEHCLRDGYYYLITPDNVFGYLEFMPAAWQGGGLADTGKTDGSVANLVEYTSTSSSAAVTVLRMPGNCYTLSGPPKETWYQGRTMGNTWAKFFVADCASRESAAANYKSSVYNYVRLPQALEYALGFVGASAYQLAVGARFSQGTRNTPPPDWPGPPDYNQPDPTDPTTTTDPSDPGGGGTDWGNAPGDPETSCSIIDIPCNLRRLFVPQEDWAGRWVGVMDEGSEKIPFGLGSWMTSVTDGQNILYPAAPRLELGEYYFGGGVYRPVLDFAEVDAFVWWHENGRMWLWWIFLASIPWMLFKVVMQ